jgi:hypothetical protein
LKGHIKIDNSGDRSIYMDSLPFRLVFDGLNKLDSLTAAWGPPTDYGLATMNIGAYVGAARNITQDPNVTLAVDMALYSLRLRLSMLAEITNANTASPIAYSSSSAGFAGYAAVSAYYGVALRAVLIPAAGAPAGGRRCHSG